MFSIEFMDQSSPHASDHDIMGEITIGDFKEKIILPLGYWSKQDYYRQWATALTNLIDSKFNGRTALLTQMHDPKTANFIRCWPLHREGESVYIQECILFMDQLPEPFNPNHIENYIASREAVNEDGDEISEWSISIDELKEWLVKLQAKIEKKS